MPLHTLLGANGTIGMELIPILQRNNQQLRLVSRRPMKMAGAECVSADVLEKESIMKAVAGSDLVYLLIGIQYDAKVWQRDWPVIMSNVIAACKAANAKLIFFDDVYMYGKVDGLITETTPYKPVSEKGKVRAAIATTLQKEMGAGNIKAIIARAVDFYGPGVTDKSAAHALIFGNMKKGKKAQWFINADVPRSYTFVPDAAEALFKLASTESAFGQVWHLPSALPALTGREYVKLAAKYMNASDKVFVMPKWLLRITGLFVPFMKALYEMHYQDEFPFQFDSSKYQKAFGTDPTSYEEGMRLTAEWTLKNR